jgi:hypothetical protein
LIGKLLLSFPLDYLWQELVLYDGSESQTFLSVLGNALSPCFVPFDHLFKA